MRIESRCESRRSTSPGGTSDGVRSISASSSERQQRLLRAALAPLGERLAHAAAQRLERLYSFLAELLHEGVVEVRQAAPLQRAHADPEHRVLAAQVGGRVVLGEGDAYLPLLALLHAPEAVLEARHQPARADLDRGALGAATLEGLAVDAPLVAHGQHGAVAGAGALGLVLERRAAQPQRLELAVHLVFAHLHERARRRQPLERGQREAGLHLHLRRVAERLARLRGLGLDARLDHRRDTAALDRRREGLVHEQPLDLLRDRGRVEPFEHRARRLAGPEAAVHAHAGARRSL